MKKETHSELIENIYNRWFDAWYYEWEMNLKQPKYKLILNSKWFWLWLLVWIILWNICAITILSLKLVLPN